MHKWYCEDGGPWQLIVRLTDWQYTPESFTSKICCYRALYNLRTTSYCWTSEKREFSKPLCCSPDPIKAHMDFEIANLGLCQEQATLNFDILKFVHLGRFRCCHFLDEDREFWHLPTSQGFSSDVAQQPLPWSGRSKDRIWFESTFWI